MRSFGETIREMREAQQLGLRQAAEQMGISPAYLSRIERGKDKPPKPEVIKRVAVVLGGDADMLFRLAESTDPDLADYMHAVPSLPEFLRTAKELGLTADDFQKLTQDIRDRYTSTSHLSGDSTPASDEDEKADNGGMSRTKRESNG